MHANKREEIEEIYARATSRRWWGLKHVFTGETLSDAQTTPVVLESLEFPEPVISIAIEPKTEGRHGQAGRVAGAPRPGGPVLPRLVDEETGQTMISGMGELHLEIIVDRLLREFQVEANVGKPQVAYKETITPGDPGRRAATSSRPAARGDYGAREARARARRAGSGFTFETKGRRRAEGVHPGRRQGIEEAMQSGVARPATRSWTSRSRWSTARPTTSTRPSAPSRSPARWAMQGWPAQGQVGAARAHHEASRW